VPENPFPGTPVRYKELDNTIVGMDLGND